MAARTFCHPLLKDLFSYAGPSVWNNLPQTLRHSDCASSFKAALKTHLFNSHFNNNKITAVPIYSLVRSACVRACACMCVCVCACAFVKRHVHPPCAVDRRSRNPLHYYNYYIGSHPPRTMLRSSQRAPKIILPNHAMPLEPCRPIQRPPPLSRSLQGKKQRQYYYRPLSLRFSQLTGL